MSDGATKSVTSNPSHAVGVIGTGAIGAALLERLASFDCMLLGFDIDAKRNQYTASKQSFAAWRAGMNQAAKRSVVVSVQTGAQTQEVAASLSALSPSTVLLCPTISPQDVRRCAVLLDEAGHRVIEAPTSGGPVRAAAGTMSLILAGQQEVLCGAEPLLAHLSSRRHYAGHELGQAAVFKLLNNFLAAVNLSAASQAFAAAERLGLERGALLDWISQSSGQSSIADDRLRRALGATDKKPLAVNAAIALLHKDLGLAIEMMGSGDQGNQTLAQAAFAHYERAVAQGMALDDDSQLWRVP